VYKLRSSRASHPTKYASKLSFFRLKGGLQIPAGKRRPAPSYKPAPAPSLICEICAWSQRGEPNVAVVVFEPS
jgi:hypothetical protein